MRINLFLIVWRHKKRTGLGILILGSHDIAIHMNISESPHPSRVADSIGGAWREKIPTTADYAAIRGRGEYWLVDFRRH